MPPRHKLGSPQRRLVPRAPLHLAPQNRLEPRQLRALEHGAKFRDTMLRSLPDAHCAGAGPDPPARTATRANDVVEMQPQRPHPPAARRASKPRPRAPARELPHMDADVLLDMAELDEERLRLSRDDVQRTQARDGKGRKILAVCPYHIKLDSTPLRPTPKRPPGAAQSLQNPGLGASCWGRWGCVGVAAPNGEGHQNQGFQADKRGCWGCWG